MRRLDLKIGLALILAVVVAATAAPWLAPQALKTFDLSLRLSGPISGHPLGLDEEGRDLLGLILWGGRVSLVVGLLTVLLSAAFGTFVGLVAGSVGGKWDHLFVFVTDVVLSFPSILLMIALAAFYREGGIVSIVLILSAVGWVGYARIVRAQVLSLREREYLLAAVGTGASRLRIWRRHLIPNLIAPLIVQASFGVAGVVLAESTLSFLGVGLPVDVPSWGRLVDQGVQYLLIAPHLSIVPGFAIALLILGFNFLGDGLRDYFDVREVL